MEETAQQTEQKIETKIEKPKGPGLFSKIKERLKEYRRVLDVARKPDKEDFLSSMKITGTGMILIGMIGFIIFLLYFLIPKLLGG